MNNMLLIFTGLCILSHPLEAIIVTRYKKISEPVIYDFMTCGISTLSPDYCAARVTDTDCEPLTKDWCETKDMSLPGSYFIKQSMIRRLESTHTYIQEEPIPITLTVGSEIETTFMLNTGWRNLRIELFDKVRDALRIRVTPNSLKCDSFVNGTYVSPNDYARNSYENTTYTLRVVTSAFNAFEIFFDGEHVLQYQPAIPITSMTDIKMKFRGTDGELYYIAYKAGN